MPTGTPGRPRATRTESEKTDESTSEFISKYFLPFTAVITSATFYYTGWVYLSHWYSYFGIDATQINIPFQVILLHGLPGMLFLLFSILIPVVLVIIVNSFTGKKESIVVAFITSGIYVPLLLLFGNFLWLPKEVSRPIEMGFSIYVLDAFYVVYLVHIVKSMRDLARQEPEKGVAYLIVKSATVITPSGSIFAVLPLQVVLAMVYFFISISASAVLGEWDAARGSRFFIGDWHIPKVSLSSTANLASLAEYETIVVDGTQFEYGPLGLLTSDDNVYYLVDLKTGDYYQSKPRVYIIPRSESLTLKLVVSPYVSKTPTAIPTITFTPTVIPAVTTTSTP